MRRKHQPKGPHCKIVRMRGGRKRKVCWGRKGKIVSNKPA